MRKWILIIVYAIVVAVGPAWAAPPAQEADQALLSQAQAQAQAMQPPTPWPVEPDAARLARHKREVQKALKRHSKRVFYMNAHTFMPSYDKEVKSYRNVAAELRTEHLPALVEMGLYRVIVWMGQPGRRVMYHEYDRHPNDDPFYNILVTTGIGYFSIDPVPDVHSVQWLKYLYIRHIMRPWTKGPPSGLERLYSDLLANVQSHLQSPGIEDALLDMCRQTGDAFSPVACALLQGRESAATTPPK